MTVLASPAFAQQAAAPTVEAALEEHFSAEAKNAAAGVLRKAGYDYKRLLVAEMLPSETTLFVEVELAKGDAEKKSLRYPLKLERKLADGKVSWQVGWSPVEDYARGLVGVAKKDGLAAVGTDTAWTAVERLPAFPVIVGEKAFVTPYGRVPTTTKEGDEPTENSQLAPPKKLAEHAQRWIGLTLEDEPGTANVDLILEPEVSWKRATQALMAPASFGLFRMYVVGANQGRFVALETAAPVMRKTPEGAEPLVVGMYREGDKHAFRVRIGKQLVPSDKACAENMTFCTVSIDAFEQKALDQITAALSQRHTRLAYVLFAATGDFPASEVATYLQALSTALGIPSKKIFMGYIGEKQ